MRLADVPAYVILKTGIKRSRQTVYNWATKGVTLAGESVKLRTEMKAGQIFTREEWLDEFLAKIDR